MKAYRMIVADPPWQYRNGGCEGGAEREYPTMDVEAICALPILSLADKDAVLILWATWPKLPEAVQVLAAWGFDYVTGFPWIKIEGTPQRDLWGELRIKPQYGIGYWVRGCTEAILIGRRGNAKAPADGWVGLLSANIQHSRKPDSIYDYAESLPGPYLELFARRQRPGWDVWGNEMTNTVEMPSEVLAL